MLKLQFHIYILLAFGISLSFQVLAQSDGCAGVPNLTVNTSCVNTAYSLPGTFANGGLVNASCATGLDRDDGWFRFTATSTSTNIDATAVGEALCLSVWSACGGGTELGCSNVAAGGTASISIPTVIGVQYFVQLHRRSGNNTASLSGNICVYQSLANDEPCGAIALPVNASCTYSNYTNANATGSVGPPAPGCASYLGGDVWFTVTVPATGAIIFDSQTGVITDGGMAVYSGTCASLTLLACDDDGSANGLMPSITLTGQTPGATLWVRFWEYGNNNNGTFGICASVYTPPAAPPNDNCSGATPVPTSTSSCTYTSGTISGATASPQANSCFGTDDDDVWFSFVAPSPGVQISLANITGSTTDLYHTVYAGTCGALGPELICSDPNSSTLTGLIPGNTYFIRVYSWTSTPGQTSAFDICVLEAGACGTPNNQDYCVAPAILTPGAGTFSSNTSGTYTSDTPANLNALFCGSIENNSWYSFIATGTSATFNFTTVANCVSGIQAEVYNVTEDVNGCCTNFASVSNCWNPGTATPGVVTATGLTPGNEYVLMVDGFGGDVCDFTVSNWTAVGILGVSFKQFIIRTGESEHELIWETQQESDNDYFLVQKLVGDLFETVGRVKGAGTSTSLNTYSFTDFDATLGKSFYRIVSVDFDGTEHFSEVLTAELLSDKLVVFPNPTENRLNYVTVNTGDLIIEIISADGRIMYTENITNNDKSYTGQLFTENLNPGLYYLTVTGSDKKEIIQFIKH